MKASVLDRRFDQFEEQVFGSKPVFARSVTRDAVNEVQKSNSQPEDSRSYWCVLHAWCRRLAHDVSLAWLN